MGRSTGMIADTFSFCPRCASRVEIGRVPLGSPLTCWSCRFEFVLTRGAEDRSATGQGRGEARQADAQHRPDPCDDATPAAEHWASERVCGLPPLRLFFAGTFRFPFYTATLPETILLSTGGVVLAAIVRLGLWCYYTDLVTTDKYTQALLWNGLAFSFAFGGVAALLWASATAACWLTIVRDTSHGADAVEGWPSLLKLEGLSAVLTMSNALMLSALPGLLATPVWRWLAAPRPVAIAITALLTFPLFLLSMLETRSPINPVSLPVWRSFRYAWRAWLSFHLVALAMAGATAALVMAAIERGNRTTGAIAAGVLPTLAGLIYFRLLGRLAYFCSGRMDLD